MIRRRVVAVAAALAVTVGAVALVSSAQAATWPVVAKSDPGFAEKVSWVTVCSVSRRATADPIVFPGQSGAGHNHTFSGVYVDADTTAAKLTTTPTNCTNTGDHAAYWMPTVFVGAAAKVPYTTRAYYRAGTTGADVGRLVSIPFGLKMVAGNSMATAPQNAGVAGFHCRNEVDGATVPKQATPPKCPAGDIFEASVTFPNCWDGVNLDSIDHKSHMADANSAHDCDAGHPVQIPELTIAERFTPDAFDGSKVTLAAMPGMVASNLTLHADFINAWDASLMDRLVRDCLRAGVQCQGVRDDRMPPITNN